MSRLSVTSSNSLRKSSPSTRKRAQSLGRLGEVMEGDGYQYEDLERTELDPDSQNHWRDQIRNIHSESGTPFMGMKKSITLEPNGILPRAKSTYEVNVNLLEGHPPPPVLPMPPPPPIPVPPRPVYVGGDMGSPNERLMMRREFPIVLSHNPRPITCFYSPTIPMQQGQGEGGGFNTDIRTADRLLVHPQNSPGRPYSSYDLKVSNFSSLKLVSFCKHTEEHHQQPTNFIYICNASKSQLTQFYRLSSEVILMLNIWDFWRFWLHIIETVHPQLVFNDEDKFDLLSLQLFMGVQA